jgi:hypothetical protein
MGISKGEEEVLATANYYRPGTFQHPARLDSRFSTGTLYLHLVLETKTKDKFGAS